MNISPVIIAKDASKTIGQTLESLKLFEEVIVYDTGSVDNTIEIAQRFKNTVIYRRPFAGFGESKNKAAELAKNDWILSIDADEVVGPKLLNTIRNLKIDESAVYRFKRFNYYRNQKISYSGWGKEYVVRLYNKTKMNFNCKLVHENIETGNSKIITLDGELKHFSYHSISDFVRKRDLYAELFAMENCGKRKSSPFMAFIRGAFDFINTYIVKRGIFDGYRGLLISVSNANVSFYKYLKLYEANISNDKRISMVIHIGNYHKKLKQLLNSILTQTVAPNEIILSYDCNNKTILSTINEFEKFSFIPIIHSINNLPESVNWIKSAINLSSNEYLIFIGADVILDQNFISDHSNKAKKSCYLNGSTIFCNKNLPDKENKSSGTAIFFSALKQKLRLFLLINILANLNRGKNRQIVNSYNFSFFKDDLPVTAQNNDEVAYSRSDMNELAKVLYNSGLKKVRLNFSGLQHKLSEKAINENKPTIPKALICLDRLKYLNCGLGQISVNLGRNLLENKQSGMEYSFLLPAKGFPEFDNRIKSIKLTIFRNLFPRFMRDYELCHVTHQLPQYNFGAAKKNLLTIHDLNFIYTKSKSKTKRYLKKLQQNINKSDAIVFISEFTKRNCYEYLNIPDSKIIRVIFNGVEPPGIETEKPKWLTSDKFLFSIGQFLEKKNFHVLIPFIKLLPEDLYLVIAGENDTHYGQKMKSLVAENKLEKKVFLPGGISEKQKNYLYHNCQAYVFPSVAEGFGLPVIEAMLSNKPVFCSNRTSLKEIGGDFAFFWENYEPSYMLDIFKKGMEKFNDEGMTQYSQNNFNILPYANKVNYHPMPIHSFSPFPCAPA